MTKKPSARRPRKDPVVGALATVSKELTHSMAIAFTKPGSLANASARLDEAVREAEHFLVDLGIGLEGRVPITAAGSEEPEPDTFLAFRKSDGWHLYYEVDDKSLACAKQLPLVEVSRARKRLALLQFGSLVANLKAEAATTTDQIEAAINHVQQVIASEQAK